MSVDYGTGTALQFTDSTQRQVLELGELIHMYNPDVTPIQTIGTRLNHNVTPVPIFEWMEDEYFIKRSIKTDIVDGTGVVDTATATANGDNSIVVLERQAQMELFEVGGIYAASAAGGSAALATDVTHLMCVRVGKNCDHASATDKMVQFVAGHLTSGAFVIEAVADGTDMIVGDAAGVLSLTFYGNAQSNATYGNAWDLSNANIAALVDDVSFGQVVSGPSIGYAEGAGVGEETRKKVRRLKNCTQIFREPYTITGTAEAAKHYGGAELTRLQARKLAKIKADLEFALLINGAYDLDATAENPQRTFMGLGVGSAAGAIQTFDGYDNSDMQLSYASGTIDNFDDIVELIFTDMIDGSGKKTVFASNKWMKKLVRMVRASTGTTLNAELGSDATAGLRVRYYYGPVGELEFVAHPLLKGVYENYAVAIDFSNFDMRPLRTRDLQLRDNIVQDGTDGQTSEWLYEGGPEIRNEQTHAILKLT
jgi:hypothetical protein